MKKPFIPQYDDKQFINTTHKVNLTGGEISTILYCLEGYISGLDEAIYDEITTVTKDQDDTFKRDADMIFAELQSVTDNYYAQQEEGN